MNNQEAYDFGYDFGKNGANTTNCHFSIFATTELMKSWEKGKNKATLEGCTCSGPSNIVCKAHGEIKREEE